ncbi:membrane protein, PF09925 domain protein [Leptospira interrogans serovar Bataviae str. HAI135]|nr:membrane protein, PF09925 domain protein [Leptospira interrogans serovar Bataviae str. HAI135]
MGFGLAVLALVAGLGFWKRENSNLLTVLIILYSILILGMIGLISQVYNLEGEYYQAAMLWCILSCLFLIATDSKTFLHLWILGFQIFMIGWIQENNLDHPEHFGQNQSYWIQYFYYSLMIFTGVWLVSEKFVLESRKILYFLGRNFLDCWNLVNEFFSHLTNSYNGSGIEDGIGYQFAWLIMICRLLILIPIFYLLVFNPEIDSNQKKSLGIGLVLFSYCVSHIHFVIFIQQSRQLEHIFGIIPSNCFLLFVPSILVGNCVRVSKP